MCSHKSTKVASDMHWAVNQLPGLSLNLKNQWAQSVLLGWAYAGHCTWVQTFQHILQVKEPPSHEVEWVQQWAIATLWCTWGKMNVLAWPKLWKRFALAMFPESPQVSIVVDGMQNLGIDGSHDKKCQNEILWEGMKLQQLILSHSALASLLVSGCNLRLLCNKRFQRTRDLQKISWCQQCDTSKNCLSFEHCKCTANCHAKIGVSCMHLSDLCLVNLFFCCFDGGPNSQITGFQIKALQQNNNATFCLQIGCSPCPLCMKWTHSNWGPFCGGDGWQNTDSDCPISFHLLANSVSFCPCTTKPGPHHECERVLSQLCWLKNPHRAVVFGALLWWQWLLETQHQETLANSTASDWTASERVCHSVQFCAHNFRAILLPQWAIWRSNSKYLA